MKFRCGDCCYPEQTDPRACGCCEGTEPLTPLTLYNRPGLSELVYRVGDHATFLQTMLARLSSQEFPALAGLSTRDRNDLSIAMLDAWATVGDVLTFYQERIANEGYLRTANERRSIVELAALVGYRPRPGVSSSVFLAYTVDENTTDEIIIPVGSAVQSIPGPDELPQIFETSEKLKARASWNNLGPRLSRPQTRDSIENGRANSTIAGPRIYLKGTTTNLQPNDPLLVDYGFGTPTFYRVGALTEDSDADRTLVSLLPHTPVAVVPPSRGATAPPVNRLDRLIHELTVRPSIQPANSLRLNRSLKKQFSQRSIAGYRAVSSFAPVLKDTLSQAARNALVAQDSPIKAYVLKKKAGVFGKNVPKRIQVLDGVTTVIGDWPIIQSVGEFGDPIVHEEERAIHLDASYTEVLPDDWLVIETQETRLTDAQLSVVRPLNVDSARSRARYGISGPTTRIELSQRWINLEGMGPSPSGDVADSDFDAIRTTTVYTQPVELELAEEPIEPSICGGATDPIELDGFYEDLEPGHWVIVSGERDITDTTEVRFSELAMLSAVTQDVVTEVVGEDADGEPIETVKAGESIHTFIELASELSFCFKRDTVKIYGNVVKATNGESRSEVLGSGDGSKAFQEFVLKQKPLTYVSAFNPSGVDSSLQVYVNDVRWHETAGLIFAGPGDRRFATTVDNEDTVSLVFGNGVNGARLPTGAENIRAEYRAGIGKPGNVRAEQISLLKTKPLGVKEVINPLRASGGADRESGDQARKNAPLAIKALDRLVSVQDYEDFSRTYAGIGKAVAVEISDGRRQLVHVTIAGADDIPIETHSDLFRNLRQALLEFGDPYLPLRLAVRELMMVVLSARIKIGKDHLWEVVVEAVRDTLLDRFGFERRELGQGLALSAVISVIQSVRGVEFVDVEAFGGVPEKISKPALTDGEAMERRLLTPEEIAERVQQLTQTESGRPEQKLELNMADYEDGEISPAQIAFINADVPETLILNQIK